MIPGALGAIVRHALWPPRRPPSSPDTARFYPAPDMIASAWVFFVLALFESAVLHALGLMLGHSRVLLVLAVLSDAMLVCAIAILRSLGRLPTTIAGDRVTVRVGLLFALDFPAAAVDPAGQVGGDARVLNGALLASPNLVLVFRAPVRATVLGLRRLAVDGIRLKLDRPDEFLARLAAASDNPGAG
ncbi:hypothetical protein H7F50_08235 [Novosphingobium flavum]|jgi:hypothetical protein|uniref:Uncharacterized protein n=1 Tax=Novosphingobium aerophilum TaxID=2839843 RepID=A0A7X1F7M2_9SPHN|nr:hypothetical protein [Novosphingobium aerophilum]MBC2651857.1 hypothetical protein [Novosphingobium aerophilum]MBC2661744.1 hypothetical protein [Novosphingobium aerophilum]